MIEPHESGMDYPADEAPPCWADPSGTVTLANLGRRLAALSTEGRPLLICSTGIGEEVRAVAADYPAADVYESPNMPGDRRIYLFSPAARPVAGL